MLDTIGKTFEQAAAFQKLWTDSFANMTGALSQFSPSTAPLEEARKMRTGMLKALGETWEEFMRTPQFMDSMKTSLNTMMDLQRTSREGLNKLHEQFEIPSKEDIDSVLLAIRHVERRVLDRIETLDERLAEFNERLEELEELSQPYDHAPQGRSMKPQQNRTTVPKRKRATTSAATRHRAAKNSPRA